MSDEFNINPASAPSLNRLVDGNVFTRNAPMEKYSKGDEGNKIAIDHQPPSDTDATPKTSWTIAEIERTIAAEALPVGRMRLGQFGAAMARRNDFRLREMTRRIDRQTRLEFPAERIDPKVQGPRSNALRQIRDFDIRNHAYRQIATNATLASYQFQRTTVLPYMRKSLALDYQRTNLLKQVVSAVGTLEKSLVSKLEAIKMNTGAAAPTKVSLFTRIKNAIRDKQIDRIAGNVSNKIMDIKAKTWNEKVKPVLREMHEALQVEGPEGGANRASRKLTTRLNKIRKKLERESQDTSSTATFANVKRKASGFAADALGKVVGFGQNFKMSPGINTMVTTPIARGVDFMRDVNPFSGGAIDKDDIDDLEKGLKKGGTLTGVSQFTHLNDLLKEWKDASSAKQTELIQHVSGIREQMGTLDQKALPAPKQKRLPAKKTTPRSKASTKVTNTELALDPPTVRRRKRSGGANSSIGKFLVPRPVVTPATVIKPTISVPKLGLTAAATAAAAPVSPLTDVALAATEGLKTGQLEQSSLLQSLLGTMSSVGAIIQSGNDARAAYEENQTKRQKIADTIADRSKVRKGSYEDLQAQKQAKKAATVKERMKEAKDSLAARLKAGGDEDGEKSSWWDTLSDLWNEDEGSNDSKDSGDDKKKKDNKPGKRKRRSRRGRPGARERLNRMRSTRGTRGVKRIMQGRLGDLAGDVADVAKSGARQVASGATGTAKIGKAGKLISLAKGGLSLANSPIGRGTIVGIGASLAGSALANSDAPEAVKQAGGTLTSMASYGSAGAAIGSIVPILGTGTGAVIGASLGALIANADKVSATFSAISEGASGAVKGLWSSIFGQDAVVTPSGKVIQQEKSSLLGDIKIAFFGRKARYSATGEVITTERGNILSNIQYGFEKAFFGDKMSNGEFIGGTSLLDLTRDGLKNAIEGFQKQLYDLPTNLKDGFKKGALYQGVAWAGKKISEGAAGTKKAVSDFMAKPEPKQQSGSIAALLSFTNAAASVGSKTKDAIANLDARTVMKLSSWLTPHGFMTGLSNAITGWWMDSAAYDDPAKPQYKFVEYLLGAYGIKNRQMYKFIHTLQISQEKINNNQTKPFTDGDMASMSSRFGFDPKNQDGVNYFKLWYTKRFIPAMQVIEKSLKLRGLTFSSVLAASDKDILALNEVLKQEIQASGVLQLGMEPTVAAYNKYAKIGTSDPGGVSGGAMNQDKPYDPRDPNRQSTDNSRGNYNPNDPNSSTNGSTPANNGYFGSNGELAPLVAARKQAAMAKGNISDQPEFRAAFIKLTPELKRVIQPSLTLQFLLWSTAIQHGPNDAAEIFKRNYSSGMDEASFARAVYQDRAGRFGNLNENDRAAALSQLSREQKFSYGIQNGTSNMTRNNLESIVSGVYDPSGNYSAVGNVSAAQTAKMLQESLPGVRVTSTTGGRHTKNSYHYRNQAVDFVPQGGMGSMNKDQVRRLFESKGYKIKELLGPGDKGHSDHFHVAWESGPSGGGGYGGARGRKGVVPITSSVRSHVEWAAQQLGVSPVELASLMSYESVGSFDPSRTGGKGGNYQGLFQFGPNERQKYGVDNRSSSEDQIKAFVRFAMDRGYRPGMGWQKLYTTINGGNPHVSVNASDGNGTQLKHYRNIQTQHQKHAIAWLQGQMGVAHNNQNMGQPVSQPPRRQSNPNQGAQPAPRPQGNSAPAPAPKPKPKPRTAETLTAKERAQWDNGLSQKMGDFIGVLHKDLADRQAERANTKPTNNNTVVAPVIMSKGESGGNPFLTMNMKKHPFVTGK